MDDMFVILNALANIKPSDEKKLENRIGMALAQAGGAIFITTATDLFAFCVGTWTVKITIFFSLTVFSDFITGHIYLFIVLRDLLSPKKNT